MEIIPRVIIYWYITVFISTEFLSYLNLINRSSIVVVNLFFFIFILLTFGQKLKTLLKKILVSKTLFVYSIVLILGSTFIQGIFGVPNTTDSMVYHLPRVMYWVQDHTLYQDVIRNEHDFMAPFAEYILIHLYLIFNGDRLLFFSQWLSFAVAIILSFLIAKQLRATSKTGMYIALFVASLPMGVMQATSTQTDMITTVMVMFSIYFALIFVKMPSIKNSLLFGFAVGLGILTKATFILFAIIPVGILAKALINKRRYHLLFILLSLLIIGIIQIRFLSQNLRIYGNFTGQKISEGGSYYINQLITPQVILSNIIRSIFLHLPVPLARRELEDGISYLHNIMGLSLNDPKTTYADTKFSVLPIVYPQEDIVGNPLHLIIIFIAGVMLILKRKKFKILDLRVYFYLLVVVSLVLFSAILKWQPFHSRLQMPLFIMGTISSIMILSQFNKSLTILKSILILSVSLAILLIILNVSKPYISYSYFYNYVKSFAPPLSDIPEAFYNRERDRQYFTARYYWYYPYRKIMENLQRKQVESNTIAFQLMDGFEYPLWVYLKKSNLNLRVIPLSKKSNDTIIFATSIDPYKRSGYTTECIKTEIEYGYACLSRVKK